MKNMNAIVAYHMIEKARDILNAEAQAGSVQRVLGVCIVCGSKLLLRICRGHPDNAKIHCNDCGSEIPINLHNQRNKIGDTQSTS